MMGLIFLRIVLTVLLGIGGGAVVLVLLGIGQSDRAIQAGIITAILVWLIQPCAEDRAEFQKFQESRQRYPGA